MNYDKKKYKIWNWKSGVILHWKLNPGVVIGDLFLGQTIPKIMLIEREGEKPLYKRSFVPCPHCGTLHNGLKWSTQNKTAYKNWYGYYCDNCSKIIPVHRNYTSLLIMAVTFPIWGWFRKSMKQRWLEKQPERFKDLTFEIPENKLTTKYWLKLGLLFALIMYVVMTILFPLIDNKEMTQRSLLIGIPIWLICGLGWGYWMKTRMMKKGKNS